MQMRLSSRLQAVYESLVPQMDVWDLCCDHGYLGWKAHQSGNFHKIHFVDAAAHLIEVIKGRCAGVDNIHFYPVEAQKIETPLTGNVVIAGVGAELICKIVFGLLHTRQLQADRLLLVPHKHPEKLHGWLEEHENFSLDYRLSTQSSVEENGRVRQIFVFDRV